MSEQELRFACDAMLRGLARWLRAWGWDATWTYGIDDAELLDEARREGRIVVTADRGILARRTVKEGRPPAVGVSNAEPPLEQLFRLARDLGLERRPSRCMGCGGALHPVDKASVEAEAPPRTWRWRDAFQRCERCGRLYWEGTHSDRIRPRLDALERRLAAARVQLRSLPGAAVELAAGSGKAAPEGGAPTGEAAEEEGPASL